MGAGRVESGACRLTGKPTRLTLRNLEAHMNRFATAVLATLAFLATPLVGTPSTSAADLSGFVYERSDGSVCGDARVLNRITERFRYQVRHVPHLPAVDIVDFGAIHQNRYLPASETWPIARHYCRAQVALSDGANRSIWYLIERGQGFASIGDNVEFCVSGFDRWLVYNGRCRVLR